MSSDKDLTVPELLTALEKLEQWKPLNEDDLKNVQLLRQQRTFTRWEKQLITSLTKKYNLKQVLVESTI